ncbi:hypothetical protein U729_139 [Clostridium baratii str. Sullivan]|uniref:Uncharacterized protein n=1 Tax=Clostridium baratii str. Sullivan TaxID=1415775 RepID=A0A0A7FTL0_9CLOT|nr:MULTISPECIES: hypothetical protein [Clostridium]AIY82942.1 hypothetical protein U729_139 [Clostridium baratii str. Sullivan]MDU1053980.1 hypothetical protein [Clostridium baratii]MDU1076064.1 hypothetical protein [Clostridium sp.]
MTHKKHKKACSNSCPNCTCHSSKEPNDGTFIEKNPHDSFSSEGTVRYGEETDVDDI